MLRLPFALVWILVGTVSSSLSLSTATAHAQPPAETPASDADGSTAADDSPAADDSAAPEEDGHQPDQAQVGALLDEEARTRFQLGSTLYRQGRFDDAAREFRAAYEVSHRPELLYNLYLVERDAGHTTEAAEALRTYLSDAEDVPDRGLMEGRLAALDRQVAAAAQQTHDTGDTGAGSADQSGTRDGSEILPTPPPIEGPSRVLPISLMAGGGAVLAVGAVFAILAKGKHDDLSGSCMGGVCLDDGSQSDINALRRDDLVADISFGIGGAAVAAGVIVWLLQSGGDSEHAEATPPRFNAGCGTDGCSLSLEGSF